MSQAGFWPGLILGFSIAAPVGPIGVLCIRRTLAHGRLEGLATGLGAATADAFYGSIAAFGLTALAWILIGQGAWLRPVGAALLGILGLRAWFSRPETSTSPPDRSSLGRAYLTTFGLTLTNPLTILSFAGGYAGLGLGTRVTDNLSAAAMVAGVFVGSVLWWITLTVCVGWFRSRLGARAMRWINRLSGAVLLAFAAILLLSDLG